ncbi:MAG: response regulator transcription factor [Micrococcus sp.]|nr:response regulator transcription factor [Micrococcus sp.]
MTGRLSGAAADAPPIGVLVVDDDPLVTDGWSAVLQTQEDLEVTGTAHDGAAALAAVDRHPPDVVLMDIRMPVLDGLTATARLAEDHPRVRVVVVTTFESDAHVWAAMRAGAAGFVLKRAPATDLVHAVRTVHAQDALLFPSALRRVAARHTGAGAGPVGAAARDLTGRETEVLHLLARGLSNAEIAAELHVGRETVKTHVGSVLGKLGARDRTHAVVLAYELGYVFPGAG